MEGFSWIAFGIGFLKGIPAVLLSVIVAKYLVRWQFFMDGRDVNRVVRMLLLCACGFAACWAISIVTCTPYDGTLHPVVTLLLIPYTFYAYLQIYRYESRCRGLREGNSVINRNWLVGMTIPVIFLFGLYPMDAGMDAHAFFVIGVWIFYFGIGQYIIFFSDPDGFETGFGKNVSGFIESILSFAIYMVLAYYCWTQFRLWPGYPNF